MTDYLIQILLPRGVQTIYLHSVQHCTGEWVCGCVSLQGQ